MTSRKVAELMKTTSTALLSTKSAQKPTDCSCRPECPRVVVLISGKRKCGKDFVAEALKVALEQRALSVCVLHLSAPLKRRYAELHGLDFDELLTASGYKELHRLSMVRWGEKIRGEDPGYFCRLAISEANKSTGDGGYSSVWIVADCRRPSDFVFFDSDFQTDYCLEIARILKVRVLASDTSRQSRGWKFEEGVDNGETECALDCYDGWDFVVVNDGQRPDVLDLNCLTEEICRCCAAVN